MKITFAARTDVGKRRKINEDAHLVDAQLGLFVVADGMGGHAAGEVASQTAVAALQDSMISQKEALQAFAGKPDAEHAEAVRRALERAVHSAAYQVFGITEVDPDHKGMGTTLSVLLLLPQTGFVAHVGDSRIYMIRSGQYKLITDDHTFVAAMVQRGELTEEEARQSRYSNVLLRAVGPTDYVEVDTRVIQVNSGDTFVLCSDGLHRYLDEGEIVGCVNPQNLDTSADGLIQLANDRGGADNITTILIRVED